MRKARTPALIALGLLAAAAVGVGAGYLLFDDPDDDPAPPVAPTVVVEGGSEEPAADASSLGFPGFATLNTTRVGGADATSVAAGVALAAYPSSQDVGRPRLVTLVPADSWQAGIAAAPLTSTEVGGPILLSTANEVPELTAEALDQLDPTGLKRADGAELVVVGDAEAPGGLEALDIPGSDPAELANEIDKQRETLSGVKDPDHILVVSSKESDYAMPAAAWAARSGDPIVFADGSDVPEATLEVLERHPEAPVYVLGPDSVIAAKAVKTLAAAGGGSDEQQADAAEGERKVVRVGADDPVENAIEFARFVDGTFGWNINDPGHGFVIANTLRPDDAAAAAPISAAGKPGPLLLTDDATEVPKPLEGFLLDTKPGYVDDPTRAIYNHVWVVGDDAAISVPFQVEVDRLTELSQVSEGSGLPEIGPTPGTPEPERQPKSAQ